MRSRVAVAVVGGLLAMPCGATGAVTVTVGRQSLATFNDYFHCQGGASSNCDNSFSPTALTTAGDRATVPADGQIVAWRVVGACILTGGVSCDHRLRVLRPDGIGQFTFVSNGGGVHTASSCDRCAPLDGSKIDVNPGLTVRAGDYIGVSEEAVHDVDARVMVQSAPGAAYNIFAGLINDGIAATPIAGTDYEPLFNADVVLDAPVVSAIDAPTGSTTGYEVVTVTGNHLAGATQVRFGDTDAADFTVVSTTKLSAVTPPHAAGTVDMTVTTAGGTDAAPFTFVSPPGSGGGGSAYVADGGGGSTGSVWQYDVVGGDLLVPKTPSAVAAGRSSLPVAISSDGRSLYAASFLDATVWQYDIGSGGLLTPLTPATVATGGTPRSVAVSPDGHSVYVPSAADGVIWQYDRAADGRLTPMTPATVATGTAPQAVAVSPDGHSVYVPNGGTPAVWQYDRAAGGQLTAKTPATVATGSFPRAVAVSPDGQSVYVASGGNAVSQYDVGDGGRLAPKTPASVPAGSNPANLAITPDGHSLYAANISGGNVSQYDVGDGGRLAPKTPATVAAGFAPFGIAVSADGRSVYVTDNAFTPYITPSVLQYDVAPDGRLAPDPTQASVQSGTDPAGIALRPDQGPVAAFAAAAAPVGAATGFDASASNDPDGSVARYDWDFGDGTVSLGAGPAPSHVYATPGSYAAVLTVSDDRGCSTTFVFTGQTALCNGSGAARIAHTVTVPVPSPAGGGRTGPAPAQFFRLPSRIRVDRKGRFRFAFRATPGLTGEAGFASAGRVRISRTGRVTLARKSFSVPAGGKVTLRVRLSRRNLGILKRNRRIKTRVTVTLKDAAGLSSRAARTIVLLAPKRTRR